MTRLNFAILQELNAQYLNSHFYKAKDGSLLINETYYRLDGKDISRILMLEGNSPGWKSL